MFLLYLLERHFLVVHDVPLQLKTGDPKSAFIDCPARPRVRSSIEHVFGQRVCRRTKPSRLWQQHFREFGDKSHNSKSIPMSILPLTRDIYVIKVILFL